MGSIPLPALDVKQPENPVDQFSRILQIKHLMQANQAGANDLRQQQLSMADDQKVREAWLTSNGDPEAFKKNMLKQGVGPKTYAAQLEGLTSYQQKLATLSKDQLDNSVKDAEIHRGPLLAMVQAPPAQKQQLYSQYVQQNQAYLQQHGINAPAEYPGDETVQSVANTLALGSQLAKESSEQTTANARKSQADTQAQRAPFENARDQAQTQLAQHENTQLGQVTPKDKYVQQQENYRALLARQAATANQRQNQGITALQKQSDTYTQFLGTANSLKQSLIAAQNGNEMAAAVAPLQGTLFVTTAEGVKRINETELKGVSGAGSLVQRINGALGKTTGKGPLSNQLKQDMAKLVDIYTDSKYQSYQNQAAYTQKLHGLDPQTTPILAQDGSIAGAPNAPRPQMPNQNPGGGAQNGYVRIKASDGSLHDIPQQNLGAARQRDPNLQVMQ